MRQGETARKRVIVIGGPTGVGKSSVAFRVAEEIGGEIISADSMQFYREINIGTGKVPPWMREKIPHHLMDFLSLRDSFDVYEYVEMVSGKVDDILKREKVPLIVGGSGLYLRILMRGIFTIPDADREKQKKLREILERKTTEALYMELEKADPAMLETIHKNDRKRIRRALEVYHLTGKPMSSWQKQETEGAFGRETDTRYFILTRNREEMYNRIDQRVDRMFEDGWIEEVKRLKEGGYAGYLKEKAPIGYAEIMEHLNGSLGVGELKDRIKRKTRNFARRQLTWFRRENGVWIELEGDGGNAVEEIAGGSERNE